MQSASSRTRRGLASAIGWLVVMGTLSAAHGALAPHLQTINYGEVANDSRYEALVNDGGTGQAIAVFDSGVDPDHLAFSGRSVTGINQTGQALDGEPDWSDVRGHGTAVTSIAAGNPAVVNSRNVEFGGIARGVDMVSVRVTDSTGSGSFKDIIAGMDYVIDQVRDGGRHQHIEAINMSLGTAATFSSAPTGSATVHRFNQRARALAQLGVPIIAASGNAGSTSGLSFPAISEAVLSVGASDGNGAISSFTNRSEALDLLAPGEDIWLAYQDDSQNNLAGQGSGTSFAAPQVTGALMLVDKLFEQRAGREPTVEELRSIITTSGSQVTEGDLAFPRLDLAAAFAATPAHTPEPQTLLILAAGSMLMLRRHRRPGRSLVAAH